MINKVVNIMPNISQTVLSQCNELAEQCSRDVYKIFVGFPLLFPYGEEFRPIALIISTKGILFFTDNENKVFDEEVFLRSRLELYDRLRIKTSLRFCVKPVIYNEGVNICEEGKRFISDSKTIEPLDIQTMRFVESALTGMLTKRNLEDYETSNKENSVLKEIKRVNFEVATFDNNQYQCIEARGDYKITAIRGLAGCGKTVVLCKIAANELYRNPKAKICYTYQTRSMYGQAKARIKDFLISSGIVDFETAMEKIDVIGSWGGFNNPGLLNKVCHNLNINGLDLETSRMINFGNPFLGFCEYVEKELGNKKIQMYDYIMVDEAQDLNPVFLRICFKILKKGGKLIYAYDDFQTLSETTLPSPQAIFPGEKSIKSFPLSICYRTPPKILSLAHALSMGIYREPPTFYQFPANSSDWVAMGYEMEKGDGTVGQETILSRSGPEYYSSVTASAVKSMSPKQDETEFDLLARLLFQDLRDGLTAEDILIIDLDGARLDIDFQKLYSAIDAANQSIGSEFLKLYFAGSLSPNRFTKSGCITFSGVKRAKGNEAFRVYIINAAKTMSQQFPIVWRNRLFTAMTRTRLQIVFVNSTDEEQQELTKLLFDEMRRAKEKDFKLEFAYPSPSDVKKIIETAKTEEMIMDETDTISMRLKKVASAGNDKVLDVLKEVISSNLSAEDIEKLLSNLKGEK